MLTSAWRWQLLLRAQDVRVPARTLLSSYLVAGFFNNFLPSTIGGDVVRIRDTARPAQSKTLATTVVFVDRALGLMGLVLVAALGATVAMIMKGQERVADLAVLAVGRVPGRAHRGRAGGARARRPRPPAAAAHGVSSRSGSASGSRS